MRHIKLMVFLIAVFIFQPSLAHSYTFPDKENKKRTYGAESVSRTKKSNFNKMNSVKDDKETYGSKIVEASENLSETENEADTQEVSNVDEKSFKGKVQKRARDKRNRATGILDDEQQRLRDRATGPGNTNGPDVSPYHKEKRTVGNILKKNKK